MNLFKKAPRCVHRHTIETHPRCFDVAGEPVALGNQVKVLSLDVETLPLLGYSWGVWNQNIYPDKIKKDWCLLSYSAKWIDSPNIISNVLSSKEAVTRNDNKLANELWYLIDTADIIIGHNSKRFDIKKINTRFWKYNLHKPKSYKHIDTLVAAKAVFGLTYNKLDFIAEFKGVQQKIETNFELWERCDEGNKVALQEMRGYNERDVSIQENIYYAMREWIPNHPNLAVLANIKDVCPICLSTSYKQIGLYTADVYQYKEHRCNDCGSVFHDSKAIKEQ